MQIETVTDPDDPRLDDYRRLTDVALRRRTEPEGGLYIAESAKVLTRALAAGHRPRSVLTQSKWLDDVTAVLREHSRRDAVCPVYVVSSDVAAVVSGYEIHRGVLAAMHRPALPAFTELVRDARLVLVLEDVVDHTNVGAIFRAAAGLGADAVLVSPRCADPLYRRSVRVSMGTVFQVPWARLPDWVATAEGLHDAGFHLAGLALADHAVPLDDFARAGHPRVALLLGTEGDGLSSRALTAADTLVTIPMSGGVDSLNVAAAGAVALWELRAR